MKIFLLLTVIFWHFCFFADALLSKSSKSKRKKAKTLQTLANEPKNNTRKGDTKYEKLKRWYRLNMIDDQRFWNGLHEFENKQSKLSNEKRLDLTQLQADMLLKAKYPITSALYAMDTINSSPSPLSDEVNRSWNILAKVVEKRTMHLEMEQFAENLKLKDNIPQSFGSNWYFFTGNAAAAKGLNKIALKEYEKIKLTDRYYPLAKYQQAVIYLDINQPQKAETALQAILNENSYWTQNEDQETIKELNDYTHIALARLYYQEREFRKSIHHYRAVSRNGGLFYDALFEQSWALFMGGYPNHTLGALHGADSPFFDNVFNPETSILRALVYYWLCRYEDSRTTLADFMDHHAEAVESLGAFLDRKRLTADTSYQLFEDLISGVSSESLGIPTNVLHSASTKDSMLLLRDEYASFVAEKDRMRNEGIFKSKNAISNPEIRISKLIKDQQQRIGNQFLVELKEMKNHFDELYEQAQFLYLELLMSEKEQLLGRELHATSKLSQVSTKRNISGWGKKMLSWDGHGKDEYWWDEVGFYIYKEQPMCQVN